MSFLSPTLDFNQGALAKIPILIELDAKDQIERISNINIMVCKEEWDSFETSWDFQRHPLFRKAPTISEAFDQWQTECDDRFNQLKLMPRNIFRI